MPAGGFCVDVAGVAVGHSKQNGKARFTVTGVGRVLAAIAIGLFQTTAETVLALQPVRSPARSVRARAETTRSLPTYSI